MAGRPKSPLRATLVGRSDDVGVAVTPVDVRRLAHLGRWYALGVDHLARIELEPDLWDPDVAGLARGEQTEAFARHAYAIRRRLSRLSRIGENPQAGLGPLVDGAIGNTGLTAWFATRYGATAAGLPWRGRATINPASVGHAWLAADIGHQIETAGRASGHDYRVVSEVEMLSVDRFGDQVVHPVESTYTTASGAKVGKRPDLAVLAPDGPGLIAVEVERRQNRPLAVYQEKLTAYRDNPSVKAVWYVCSSETVRQRVTRAANKVLLPGFPLRLMVVRNNGGWFQIPGLTQDEVLMRDLAPMATTSEQMEQTS